jgi:hypothetical protein
VKEPSDAGRGERELWPFCLGKPRETRYLGASWSANARVPALSRLVRTIRRTSWTIVLSSSLCWCNCWCQRERRCWRSGRGWEAKTHVERFECQFVSLWKVEGMIEEDQAPPSLKSSHVRFCNLYLRTPFVVYAKELQEHGTMISPRVAACLRF